MLQYWMSSLTLQSLKYITVGTSSKLIGFRNELNEYHLSTTEESLFAKKLYGICRTTS